MKMKYTLTMILLTLGFAIMAQSKVQVKKSEYYANAAAKEFKLDEEKRNKVYEAKLELFKLSGQLGKKMKAGEITEEEKKSTYKEENKKINVLLAEISGKTPKDLKGFNSRMRTELKAIKN